MRANTSGYSVTQSYQKRGRIRVVIVAVLAIVGLLAALYLGRFFEIRRLRSELSALMQQERAALVTQEELREQVALQDDPEVLEEKARELLGLVKPHEEKVIFIEEE